MSRQFAWGESPLATPRNDRQRSLPTAQCSLCGIALPIGQLVPDGGRACADIRWYCQDAQSCTERWTGNLPRHSNIAPTPASLAPSPVRDAPPVRRPPPGREAPPAAAERRPGPDPVAAELRSRPAAQAWSIDPS
jgi:hypothetical protein